MTIRRAALFALALFPLVPGAVRAQTTPDGARALQAQIHDWIVSIVGPNVPISQAPVSVTANGDHYDLAVPLLWTPDSPRWTATATPQSGGRWAINNMRIPSPTDLHFKLPEAVMANAPPGTSGDIDYKITIGTQSAQMLLDPTFATSTTSTSSMQNLDVAVTGGMAPQTSHIDSGTASYVIQPATGDRVDFTSDTTLEGYRIETEVPNAPGALKIAIGRAQVKVDMSGVSRARAVQVVQALIQVVATVTGAPPPNPLASPPPQTPAEMIELVADLATGASISEAAQDLNVEVGGLNGGLHAFEIGVGIKTVNGLLQGSLDLGAEGLTLPDLGLGSMMELIPTKVSFRPIVGNLPTDALLQIAKDGGDPSEDDIMALFARGPILAGLDSMTIDIGGAEFTGLGKLQIASPQDISGTAQITATNLDLLQQKVATEPSLAQALPVIIFLKGIGHTVGNQMIWDITYSGGRVLVNNQDLSALAGGGAAPPPQSAQPAPRPPAPRPNSPSEQLRRRP